MMQFHTKVFLGAIALIIALYVGVISSHGWTNVKHTQDKIVSLLIG